MSAHCHEIPAPVNRTLLTPGVMILATLTLVGMAFAAGRFIFGLAAVTNLDQQYPWGLWIAIDVATGVALAAGGFTTAALAHVFHREHYHAITRPALLTALLGYTFVAIGLMVDLGRPYNIWHPMWPTMWQGNSVLFEVGICVMCYLTVLYIEFLPAVCERFEKDGTRPRLARLCRTLNAYVGKVMAVFIIAGVVLSCLHQSSLGNLMVIAPDKMHPLWYTPLLPLLFLLSAFAVGFPMVIVESMYASWALKLNPEMKVLSPLARYIPVLLGIYLAFKLCDLAIREAHVHLADGSAQSMMFLAEMVFGLMLPFAMLLSRRVRRHPKLLLTAALLVVLGVALNRVNVFLTAYSPPYAVKTYVPSVGEIAVTVGLISLLMLCYRVVVTYFPVISQPAQAEAA